VIGYNVTLLYGHMLIMDTCMLETVKFFPPMESWYIYFL